MDNLVRLSEGLPIIQLDYTNAVASVTFTASETASDSYTTAASGAATLGTSSSLTSATTHSVTPTTSATTATVNGTSTVVSPGSTTVATTTSATPATVTTVVNPATTPTNTTSSTVTNVSSVASTIGTALTALAGKTFSLLTTHSATNLFTGSQTSTNTNQVTLTATPVTTSNDVYDAYLYYMTLPGSLQCANTPPAPETAILVKKRGKQYFWIPVEMKKEFMALSLATTAQRGRPIAAPQSFDVTILGVTGPPIQAHPERKGGQTWIFNVVFDPKVPNSPGRADIDSLSFDFDKYKPDTDFPPATTNIVQLYIDFTPTTDPMKPGVATYPHVPLKAQTPDQLVTAFQTQTPKASLRIRGYRPEGPTTNQLLEKVNSNIQQLQLNQLRGNPIN
jgi:hypothetical protein